MKKTILLLCFLTSFMAGCSTKQNDISEPVYNKINNETIKEQKQKEDIVSEASEVVDENGDDDELGGFKGIVSDVETPADDYLSINSKLNDYIRLVCPDIENNIIYYVNYGKDDYIYQLKDGASTLVLDRKTQFIQLWEDELYFFGFTDDATSYSNIYKYNLTTKKVELLVETNPCWMYINSNGIYYARYNIEKGYIREGYRLPFGSTEPEPYKWHYFVIYKDYMVVFERVEDYSEPGTIKLIKQDTGECVLEIQNVLGRASVYRDNLYYISLEDKKRRLHIIKLLTGEHNICDPNNIYPEGVKDFNYLVTDYTVCGEDIFCTVNVSSEIFNYNIKNDNLVCKRIENDSDLYTGLYTNGSKIFMIKERAYQPNIRSLVELIDSDDAIEIKELVE